MSITTLVTNSNLAFDIVNVKDSYSTNNNAPTLDFSDANYNYPTNSNPIIRHHRINYPRKCRFQKSHGKLLLGERNSGRAQQPKLRCFVLWSDVSPEPRMLRFQQVWKIPEARVLGQPVRVRAPISGEQLQLEPSYCIWWKFEPLGTSRLSKWNRNSPQRIMLTSCT